MRTTHDGAEIHWEQQGDPDADTIVMLHSLGSDGSMWNPQATVLAEGHRVICMDTRGHGRSSAPPGPYTLEMLCRDVLAVADHAQVDRFHVIGLSMGGQMALWLGAHAADRISSLVAANTGAKIGSDASWAERIDAVLSHGMPAMNASVLARWFSPDFAARQPEWFADSSATFDTTSPVGYAGCCSALAGADLRDAVATIDAPALVVGSDLDLSTPADQARWLAQHIPSARLEIIEGAGHLSNLDRHEAFNRALLDFLESL